MNHFEIAGFILVGLLLSAAPVRAQDNTAAFSPTSAWLVGPASLNQDNAAGGGGKMPCLAANQYSNGFVVRFSGGGGQLMAMAVDFRQKVFSPQKKYDVEFAVPGSYFQVINGAAYDEGTLTFGLQKIPDFYKALQKGDTLTMKVEGTTVALNLVGLNDGFRRMNECYAPAKGPSIQPSIAQSSVSDKAPQNPLLSGNIAPMPDETAVTSVFQANPLKSVAAAQPPQRPATVAKQAPAPVDEAAALMAQMQAAQKAGQEMAVNRPVNDPAGGVPMTGTWSQPNQPKTLRPNGTDVLVPATPAQAPAPAPVQAQTPAQPQMQTAVTPIVKPQPAAAANAENKDTRWRAVKGADLHDILDSWATGSGTKLMWMASQPFAVQRSIGLSGTFEAATASLLEQFADLSPRPVGRIYKEPGSSQLVLVIEQAVNKAQ